VRPQWSSLVAAIEAQPTWSSYPFVLLIGQRRGLGQMESVYSVLPPQISNVVILERPMSAATLLSTVRWALAGRQRQFTTRDHLDELERNAQQQRLMTRELAHRVKNTIAVLQSIVTQTMRPHPQMSEVRDQIIERFSALARAHDLLLSTDFTAADFGELLQRTLSVHGNRFITEGPALQLSPQASLSFALVLHELATNATKYGALRTAGGAVDIKWNIDQPPEKPVFHFSWQESGGPPVSKPEAQGFGSRLIRSTLAGLGTVDMEYAPSGFVLRFSGQLSALTHSVVPQFH
jgi:two-component sensor histidine kinase